ncbi:MAG: iron-containing alcohol dehydrogenase [Alphaproteobacteria bacterium]|nr:iron-containing alcohol dehydrogenase [Alphaproteobacteria bacterium]
MTAGVPLPRRGTWSFPTSVRFGAGRISRLADACRELGMRRPLLVTDPGLAPLPMVAAACASCSGAGLDVAVFSGIRSNPTGGNVEDGVTAYRAARSDGVIGFGGGSALDAAKAIALMVGQERPLWDFAHMLEGPKRVRADAIAPLVAVATTAGTGSDFGRCTVITDEATHTKHIICHPRLMPGAVIVDPELTVGLPPALTATTGMDALAHNLEAYFVPAYHPMADAIALEGARLIATYLPRAFRDGRDLDARAEMMAAAGMGATAFQKGLGAIHAISHPVGAIFGTHHGLTNAVVMPYVLVANRPAIADKLTRLARVLELPAATPEAVLDWVLDLRRTLGIPHTLNELGVAEADAARLAPLARADSCAETNPMPLDEAGYRGLIERAVRGDLGSA